MIYRFSISTPSGISSSVKQKTTLKLCYGIIHHIDIQFPPGPMGLLHLHINDAIHQIFPYNTDESFASHNVNISFREFFPLLSEPFELQAYTWNTDETYDHVCIIRIGILHPRIIAPWLLSFKERIQSIIGEL